MSFRYHPLPPVLPPIPFPSADGHFANNDNNNFGDLMGFTQQPIDESYFLSHPNHHVQARTWGQDIEYNGATNRSSLFENPEASTETPTRSFVFDAPNTYETHNTEVLHAPEEFEEVDLTADFMALRDDISQEDRDHDVSDNDTPEFQLVMTDEWKEYFSNSAALRKHKKKREAAERRRKESGYYDNNDSNTFRKQPARRRGGRKKKRRRNNKRRQMTERELQKRNAYQNELEFSSLGRTRKPTTLTAQSRLERKQKSIQLYGAAVDEVQCAETFLNERFDRSCDDSHPIMWPEMPIKLTHETS